MATHSSVLAWRIPGMAGPGGLPSMGSHRVGHNWSDLAAAAAADSLKKKKGEKEVHDSRCPGEKTKEQMRLYFLHLKIISKSMSQKNWPLTMDGLGSTGLHCLCLFSDTKGAFRVLVSEGNLPQSQPPARVTAKTNACLFCRKWENMNLVWRDKQSRN